MLQINYIRQNTELVKERLAIKEFKQLELIDEIILLDQECRQLKKNVEDIQMQLNTKSSEIPKLIKNGKKEEADKLRDEATLLKTLLNRDKPELEQKNKSLLWLIT